MLCGVSMANLILCLTIRQLSGFIRGVLGSASTSYCAEHLNTCQRSITAGRTSRLTVDANFWHGAHQPGFLFGCFACTSNHYSPHLPFHLWVFLGSRDVEIRFTFLYLEVKFHSMMVLMLRNTNLPRRTPRTKPAAPSKKLDVCELPAEYLELPLCIWSSGVLALYVELLFNSLFTRITVTAVVRRYLWLASPPSFMKQVRVGDSPSYWCKALGVIPTSFLSKVVYMAYAREEPRRTTFVWE